MSANVFPGSPSHWMAERARQIAWLHLEHKYSNGLREQLERAFRDVAEKAWNAGRCASENATNPFDPKP